MFKILTSIHGFLLVCSMHAQIVLDHAAVSPFAVQVYGDEMMTSTVGQIETNTLHGSNHYMTQGFEQPSGYNPLIAELQISYNLCTESYDVKVTSVSLCAENDSIAYFWNGDEGTSEATGLPPQTSVHIVSIYGCVYHAFFNFDEMTVVETPCDLTFYNYISPNGDGDNDVWQILNITAEKYSDNEVTIYSRWGSEVWSGKKYDNQSLAFYGKSKDGEPLPDGTYFYIVKAAGLEFNGYIELHR